MTERELRGIMAAIIHGADVIAAAIAEGRPCEYVEFALAADRLLEQVDALGWPAERPNSILDVEGDE